MELRHLRYFQAVAEELNFSRAAKRLNIAQPALSRAVQQLEHSLGVALLERTRHMVRITPAGAVLLREAAGLLQQVPGGFLTARSNERNGPQDSGAEPQN